MNFKKLKRLASVVLSLSMVLSMNVTTFATEAVSDTVPYTNEVMPLEEDTGAASENEVTVTLNKTTLSLVEGATDNSLTASISPDGTDGTITWSSEDQSIATVTESNGTVTVTAVKAGTTNIVATLSASQDGTREAIESKCAVTVTAASSQVSITLNPTTLNLTAGGATGTITATVTNAEPNATVTWESANTNIATVTADTSNSNTATVTPVAAGTTSITAKVGEKTASCTVTVSAAASTPEISISVAPATLSLTAGGTAGALTATITNADDDTTVSWSSSDQAVATVSPNAPDSKTATVTPVAAGTATITAAAGDKTATCAVTVSAANVPAESITLDRTEVTLGVGETTVLTATVGPKNANDTTVTWENTKSDVATITDEDPAKTSTKIITAVKVGTTTITAANAVGKKVACKVTVIEKKSDTACTEHTYNQLDSVLKAPTCTKSGIGRYKCSKCSQASPIFQAIPASHQYDAGVVKQTADCVDGTITYTCQREGCDAEDKGHTKTDVVKATGKHNYEEKTIGASCTKPGGTGKFCSKCTNAEGALTNVVQPTGHMYDDGVETKKPTCTTTGVMTFTCSRCEEDEPGHSYTETIPVKHNPGDPEYTEANCTDYGTIKVICKDCTTVIADTRLESDKPKGHTIEKIPAVPATCTERGKSEGEQCSVCKVVLKAPAETGEVDPANHNYTASVLKPATCSAPGIKKETCTRCGDSRYVSSEVEHKWIKDTAKSIAPNCVNDGKDVFACDSCGTSKTETVKALGHDWDAGVITTPATCGKDGVKTFTCERTGCDSGEGKAPAARTEAIPKTGNHNFEQKTTAADCTHPERTGKICAVCGEADGEVTTTGNPLGHIEVKAPIKAATCTEAGSERVTCSRGCDLNEVRTIPAAHTKVITHYTKATCTENGKEVTECTACDTVLESHDLDALDPATGKHDYELHAKVPATCQKAGTTAYKQCAGCKGYENGVGPEAIPVNPNGHVYEEDGIVTIKPSDCSQTPMVQAIVKKTCSLCSDVSYEKIDAKHTPDTWTVTTATSCEKKGERKTTCSTCNKEIKEDIPATDHKYDNGTVTKAATCGEAGVRTFTCTNENCIQDKDGAPIKKSYTEAIPATGNHNFVEKTTQADCTHPIRTGRICDTCGQADGPVTESGTALGHSYGAAETTKEADCSKKQNGEKQSTCSRCGDVKKEVIDYKLTHTTTSEYKDATCTEAGRYITTCSKCSQIISTEIMTELDPATGHTVVKAPAEPATCSKPGKTEGQTCSVCKAVITEQTATPVAPDNHTYGEFSDTKAATCTENGLKYRTCSGCGKYDYAVIPAGHNWSEGELNEDGTAVISTCSGCGDKKILFVAEGYEYCEVCKKVTEPAVTPGKAATCTENGLTAGKKCGNESCDNIFETQTVIPKTGHTAGAWEVETAATCSKTGSEVQKCTVCKEVMGRRELPATGKHDWEESFVEPTCTENGKTAQVCKNCKTVNPDFEGEDLGFLGEVALGHDFADGICSRCDKMAAETTASASVDGTKNNVRFTAAIVDFPASAAIVKKGILYITSSQYSPAGSDLEEDLKIGSSCTYVKDKYTESNASNTIYFDLNVGTATTRKLYARGYVVIRENQNEKIYYGPVITTSFQELNQ